MLVCGRDCTGLGTGNPSSLSSNGRAGVRGWNPGQHPFSPLHHEVGICHLMGPGHILALSVCSLAFRK